VLNAASWAALRGAAYTGLRLPTLNELYRSFTLAAPNGNGGVSLTTTQRNPALKNERLLGFEAGIDLTPAKGVKLSLTALTTR
jgi:outer membrane receptor protein involved in Fe transport